MSPQLPIHRRVCFPDKLPVRMQRAGRIHLSAFGSTRLLPAARPCVCPTIGINSQMLAPSSNTSKPRTHLRRIRRVPRALDGPPPCLPRPCRPCKRAVRSSISTFLLARLLAFTSNSRAPTLRTTPCGGTTSSSPWSDAIAEFPTTLHSVSIGVSERPPHSVHDPS